MLTTPKTNKPALWFEGENRAADSIVTATFQSKDYILMIRRLDGTLALPGGFVDKNKKGVKVAEKAARRETKEETGYALDETEVEHQGYYRKKDRDPRADTDRWVSTQVFYFDLGEVDFLPDVTHREDPDKGAQAAEWFEIPEILTGNIFADHGKILKDFLSEKI